MFVAVLSAAAVLAQEKLVPLPAAPAEEQDEPASQRPATITALQRQGTGTPAPEKHVKRSSMPPLQAKLMQTRPGTPTPSPVATPEKYKEVAKERVGRTSAWETPVEGQRRSMSGKRPAPASSPLTWKSRRDAERRPSDASETGSPKDPAKIQA